MISTPPEPTNGLAGAVVLFSDVACPWATVVVLRLRAARSELSLDDVVAIVHLAYPIELRYGTLLRRRVIDAEIPLCAAAVPGFGWSLWQGRLDEYPVSSLLATEAVQAARRQSERAAELLDLRLREAFFVESRTITLRHEILALAADCDGVDVDLLTHDIDAGSARAAVMRQASAAQAGAAACTGFVVLPDGTGMCNPGVTTTWLGPDRPRGAPAVIADDPQVYRSLISAAGPVAEAVRQ